MDSKQIHILFIKNSISDPGLPEKNLEASPLRFTLTTAASPDEGMHMLSEERFDVVLLDIDVPGSENTDHPGKLVGRIDIPLIVLTGNKNESMGIELVKSGAQDFLLKNELNPPLLARSLRYAIERKQTENLLKNHHQQLEKLVEERTAELRRKNEQLRQEIENRIEVEKNLSESEESFRTISESAHDAIMKLDCKGKVMFWNKAAEKIFGYVSEEMIGVDPHEYIAAPEHRENAREAMIRFCESGEGNAIGKTVEMSGIKKDGTIFPVEISLSSIKILEHWHAVAIIRDISERKQAQTLIEEKNLFLNILIETIPAPLFYKNKDGLYLGANDAFLKFVGKSRDEVIGKTVFDVSPPDLAEKYWKQDLALLSGGGVQVYDYQVKNCEGEIRDVIFHKGTYSNPSGEIAGMVGIIIDITETRQSQRELNILKDHLEDQVKSRTRELQEANATKDIFFSILAHDLKNPFNSIIGFLDLINNEYDTFTDNDKKKFLGNVLNTARNTFFLLNNLLEWSKVQRGYIKYRPQIINLNNLTDEVVYELDDKFEQKKIRLFRKIPADIQAYADFNMARTVLRNLLTNAIKFSFPDSAITISCSGNGNTIKLSVTDNGIGMSKDEASRLFRIEEKVQRTGTMNEKGTGLGLILSKEFVEKNKGNIWAESEPGKGSCFTFTLPATEKFADKEN